MHDEERRQAIQELVLEWMRRARSDMAVALLINDERITPEIIAFHAQQAAEKALKALLVQRQVAFPRTHDLDVLLQLCQGAGYVDIDQLDRAIDLTRYAVASRYPGEGDPIERGEARIAAGIAAHVVAWAEARLAL